MMLSFVEYFKKGGTTMQNIVNVVENNHEKIVEAILAHYVKYGTSDEEHELCMMVDGAGEVSFKSVCQFSRNDVVYDDYFVLSRCGGESLTVWNIIGDVESCLSNDGENLIDYVNATAEEFGISNEAVTKENIAKYIMKTYPKKLSCWLKEARESSVCYEKAENVLDVFLEKCEAYYENIE